MITFNLKKFLIKDASKLSYNESDPNIMSIMDVFMQCNLVYKNYILNEMENIFYNGYSSINRAKTQ